MPCGSSFRQALFRLAPVRLAPVRSASRQLGVRQRGAGQVGVLQAGACQRWCPSAWCPTGRRLSGRRPQVGAPRLAPVRLALRQVGADKSGSFRWASLSRRLHRWAPPRLARVKSALSSLAARARPLGDWPRLRAPRACLYRSAGLGQLRVHKLQWSAKWSGYTLPEHTPYDQK